MKRLVSELRRRGVLKVATAYLILCWLVLEVGHTLFNVFELPHASLKFVFVLLALGFPVVIFGTWQGWLGAAVAGGESHDGGVSHHEGPWLAAVFGVVAVFAIAIAIGVRFFGMGASGGHEVKVAPASATLVAGAPEGPAVGPISDKSIAVLPFADMSERKDQQYFADGMADEILDLLARIPGLKVISRTSSFQFKGQSADVGAIGAKLRVAYIVEGSVRTAGNRIRVTAQLINASDGSHRWSGSYDRELADVLKVQDEISLGLVRALQVSVGADSTGQRPALGNVDAYNLYLRGRQALERNDRTGLAQAVGYFREALAHDPDSALADGWLAFALMNQAVSGYSAPAQGFEEARRHAERAASLDPKLELAVAILGSIHVVYDWDWANGKVALDRARELAPGSGRVLQWHSVVPSVLGNLEGATAELESSLLLDPLDPVGHFLLGRIELRRGRLGEAEAAFRRALEISPTFAFAHFYAATALLNAGDAPSALKEIALEPDEETRLAGLAVISHALGREAESAAALERLKAIAEHDWPYGIACVYAARHEADAAMLWLSRAFELRSEDLWAIKGDPYFKSVEADPRYLALLRRLNLPT